ncbi:hypothetical protein [Senegalia massiliensis]|uniref:Uncharacterized protein n=1 Tax=Senegalia massiliensis TaxID=1720316 RepID=A0A845R0N3_9CLOT|nr:hypothetical protein [Senegalia massiliensis]NBI07286.1 hypothetical protein [Senegalia massiliensis]
MSKIKKLEEIERKEREKRNKLIESVYAINFPDEVEDYSEEINYIEYLKKHRQYMKELFKNNDFYDFEEEKVNKLQNIEDITLKLMLYEANTDKHKVFGNKMMKYIALLENYIFGEHEAD